MLEFIGGIVVLIVVWAILKIIIYRIFPDYGYKVAERRYMEDPSPANEQIYWAARSRMLAKRRKDGLD